MFRGDQLGFLMGGSDEGSPSEVVGASQEAAGALLDGGDGIGGEERLRDAGDLEMVVEVGFHVGPGDAVQMGAGDDSGGEGERGAVEEEVGEVVLAGEDDGEDGVGVGLELGDGVKFSEDLNPEQGSLIDDEDALEFSGGELQDLGADDGGEGGARGAIGVDFELGGDLAVELEDGAAGGGDPERSVLGGMKAGGRPAERGGFTRAHIAGNESHGAEPCGVVEALRDGVDFRGLEDLLRFEVGGKGLTGEAEEGAVDGGHDGSSLAGKWSWPEARERLSSDSMVRPY